MESLTDVDQFQDQPVKLPTSNIEELNARIIAGILANTAKALFDFEYFTPFLAIQHQEMLTPLFLE